jgi:hypothetical protein
MNSRRLAEFHYGIPCADWLRTVMNRINPDLFLARFSSWVAECWPDAQSILDAEADYLLAVKDNQPTLHADIKSYFDTAPSDEIERFENLGEGWKDEIEVMRQTGVARIRPEARDQDRQIHVLQRAGAGHVNFSWNLILRMRS